MINLNVAGTVKANNYVGGIVGYCYNDYDLNGFEIKGCFSSCTVYGNENHVGGVAGNVRSAIEDCGFSGVANGKGNVGGIAGIMEGSFDLLNSNNSGSVEGKYSIGGIVGLITNGAVMQDCYSSGSISGENGVGGIVGHASGYVIGCFSSGNVFGCENIGGIAGRISSSGGNVNNCYSTGDVAGNTGVGGIAGNNGGDTNNCYATGAISGSFEVGGIVGSGDYYGGISNCVALNKSITGSADVGRIYGKYYGGWESRCSNNYAFSDISGADFSEDAASSGKNGANRRVSQILEANFFQRIFGNNSKWTYLASNLPGLLGNTVKVPAHLS